jgi:type I restriction enzyme, S subunit
VKPDDLKEFSWIEDSKEKISTTGIKKQNLIPENSVLVCCIGSIGKFGINKIPVLTNQQINSLIFNNRVNENIRKYLICSSKDEHNKNSNGNVVKILNGENQGKIKFPLTSTIEQQKIALFLDKKTAEFDSIIEKKQSFITKLTEAKKSLISEVVTGKVKVQVIANKYQVISRTDDEMKDSGVEWLGKIPKEWEVKPLYIGFKENKEKNKEGLENNVLSLSYGKIKRRDIEKNFGLLPESFDTYQIVNQDYIIFRLTDLQNDKKSLRVGLVKEKGIITSAYVGLIPTSSFRADFSYYLFHVYDLKKIYYNLGSGLRQSMNFVDLKKMPIFQLSLQEQQQIVNFLDEKTAKIDSTIEKIKLQIEKLKVAKQSLISEAVTGKIEVMG